MSQRADPIEPTWTDVWGRSRTVSAESHAALADAMGGAPGGVPPSDLDPVRLVNAGEQLPGPGQLTLEDGTDLGVTASLPRDLPHGYHRLSTEAGEQLLLCAPPRCYLPAHLRTWGWSVQLATARSRRSWGIGDLDDLRTLAGWSSRLGAGLLQVSPLGAPTPGPDPEASPYFPGTRRFRNPLYLAIGSIPGAEAIADQLDPLARAGEALNAERIVDRARVQSLKQRALEQIWAAGAGTGTAAEQGVAALRDELGASLRQWATYSVVAERLGGDWRRWPDDLRHPGSPGVAREAAVAAGRVAFHEWVQWLLDDQLRAAGSLGPGLVHDLPIGFDPGGFDAWSWQGQLAQGASMGAPPDLLALDGQDWGLPPFVPHRLRAAGYRPFIDTLRASLRHAGGLRIDHIGGFFRGWWVPAGRSSGEGAYVRFPSAELLAVLALESERAGAWVVGEDLGTIESGVRQTLADRQILSMRLVYFEDVPPSEYPWSAQALITTHDLPTVAGLWSGSDLSDQERAGVTPDVASMAMLRDRVLRVADQPSGGGVHDVILATHAALAASPSAVIVATLEDALVVEERVNLPGTVMPARHNWSIGLPSPIEELEADPFVTRLAAIMATGRPRA
ncbi:MAG: 4-alpha-glucanotransferase [Chloroflexota bacterium]|nr:4-alpha-glucanotransferase [Chloroflexota bacterium]